MKKKYDAHFETTPINENTASKYLSFLCQPTHSLIYIPDYTNTHFPTTSKTRSDLLMMPLRTYYGVIFLDTFNLCVITVLIFVYRKKMNFSMNEFRIQIHYLDLKALHWAGAKCRVQLHSFKSN